jgi:hypothetical protein
MCSLLPVLISPKIHFLVALSRIIAARPSLVAYHLASREYSELGRPTQVTNMGKTQSPS